MEGDEVRLSQQVVQRQQLDSYAAGVIGGDERVVAHQPHAEGLRAAGDLGSDAAQAADAQGLLADFNAHERAAAPLAGFQRCVRPGNVPGHGQHQRQRVLGGGHGVACGCVHHGDAGAGGRVQVDVVNTDASAGDDLQVSSCLNYLAVDLGFAADHQGLIASDGLKQFGRFHTGLDVYVCPCLQQGDALGANGIGYQDFGHKREPHSLLAQEKGFQGCSRRVETDQSIGPALR